jgi:hypothetical protein
MLYSKRFLTEDKDNANYFLKSIAYDVKMKGKSSSFKKKCVFITSLTCKTLIICIDLIRVVKTCAYHSDMPYCPVILEIKHPQLKEIFGGEYLLQVYNMNGESVFDKVLKCKLRKFSINVKIYYDIK